MSSNFYVRVNSTTNVVVDVILWDGVHPPAPLGGTTDILTPNGTAINIGWTWPGSGTTFTPSPTDAARAALLAGLTITSTGTPALNGTYAVDTRAGARPTAQLTGNNYPSSMLGIPNLTMVDVVDYINANGTFPGSAGTLSWLDISGTAHVFPTTAKFLAFYKAIVDFVTNCQAVAYANSGTLPSSSVTIA